MPRDPGTGAYSYPDGTKGNPGQTIFSGRYNTFLDDLKLVMNSALPVTMGGTGSSTVAGAVGALGAAATKQKVTNYDLLTGIGQGFVYSEGGATAAPPGSSRRFVGEYIWLDATVAPGAQPDNALMILRDMDETGAAANLARTTWVRKKKGAAGAGVWGDWSSEILLQANATGSSQPVLTMDKPSTGPSNTASQAINSTTNGVLRWSMVLGSGPDIGGGAGQDFYLFRYNDAGSPAGTALTISRLNGNTTVGGAVTIQGALNTSGIFTTGNSTGNIAVGGPAGSIQVMSATPTEPSITFHRVGAFAMNFGMANDGHLAYGGWSHGATTYKVWSTAHFNYVPFNPAGGTITGPVTMNSNLNVAGTVTGGHLSAPGGGMTLGGWGGNPNVSVIFVNRGQSQYIYYDGTNYSFTGGHCYSAAGRLWGTNDFNYRPVSSGGDTITGSLNVHGNMSTNGTTYSGGHFYTDSSWVYINGPGNTHVEFRQNGGVKGYLYHDAGSNYMVIRAGGQNFNHRSDGIFEGARGYRCKQGNDGPYSNTFNIWWDGTPELFIDASYIGDFYMFGSDYRLKRDVEDLGSTWDNVKQMRPIKYQKAAFDVFPEVDGERWGFLAHELQAALLDSAATRGKDEEKIQTLDPLAIIAALTKSLQEAMARIETLEGQLSGVGTGDTLRRITNLEGQVASLNYRLNQ